MMSVVVSGSISAWALVYARRADRRSDANAALERASFELEKTNFRIAALQQLYDELHDLMRARHEMLSGDVAAMGKATRIGDRLPAVLEAIDLIELPHTARLSKTQGTLADAEIRQALFELAGAITAARNRASSGGPND